MHDLKGQIGVWTTMSRDITSIMLKYHRREIKLQFSKLDWSHELKHYGIYHDFLYFNTWFSNIYTPSVFCYDKHKKNFDIQFSLKRHETV